MNNKNTSNFEKIISFWSKFIQTKRILIIFSAIILTIISLHSIKNNLGFSTDTSEMLSEDLDWRKLDIQYEKLFPQFLDNIIVVVEAQSPDLAADTAKNIFEELKKNKNEIKNIFYIKDIPYIKKSSFLFLEYSELQNLSDRLATIQPFLGVLLADTSLRGLFNMLSDAMEAKSNDDSIELTPIISEINYALENNNHFISWHRLMDPKYKNKKIYREFIELKINSTENDLLPNEKIMKKIREVIEPYKDSKVKVRLTGGEVLAYEELKSVSNANIKAIALSIILVAMILIIGLGSFRIAVACLTTLLIGLIITTAFASISIGTLNLISIAFAVLYIGLGIDFAIHMALRYREESELDINSSIALKNTLRYMLKPLLLCAITTAIGFYAFIPTNYSGVAELGLIAGSGMIISFIITITLLPALLTYTSIGEINSIKIINNKNFFDIFFALPYKYTKIILIFTLFTVVSITLFIDKVTFDENRLNLQDQRNESVQTYRDLIMNSETTPWEAVLIVKSKNEIDRKKNQIELLPLVDAVVSIDNFLPDEQDDKLMLIDEMSLLMGKINNNPKTLEINNSDRLNSIKKLKIGLQKYLENNIDDEITILNNNLTNLLENINNNKNLIAIENQFLKNLPGRLDALSHALDASKVSLDNIPDEIYKRWVNNENYLIKILPKEDLNNNNAMRNFVAQLQNYNNDVIGSPIISIEAGDAVVNAFKFAFCFALIMISILLLMLIKIKYDAIIILGAVLVGAIFTFGFMLLFNIPLNFANIIGLPLLLGIGVDSGIHITERFYENSGKKTNIYKTSSMRGVFISTLTTIFSIGNLSFSSHQGTASMGLLLTIGLISMLIATMLVLPSFLIWRDSLAQ